MCILNTSYCLSEALAGATTLEISYVGVPANVFITLNLIISRMRVARSEESNSTDLETLQDRFLVPRNDKKLTESQNFLSKICRPERSEGSNSMGNESF